MGQASSQAAGAEHSAAKPLSMLVAAVGVVYGDIGTSPLYTLKEVFSGALWGAGQSRRRAWGFCR